VRAVEVLPDDDAAVAAYVDAHREAALLDAPDERPLTAFRQVGWLRHGYEGEGARGFLLCEGDDVVAIGELYVTDYDNRDLAWVSLSVRPGVRRQGHGRAAIEVLCAEARRSGRSRVVLWGWEGPAMDGFAAATGFARGGLDAHRTLRLAGDASERTHWRRLRDEAAPAATDYEFVRRLGRSPDELLAALLAVTEAINDAPSDDIAIEDEVFDVDRIRAYETAQEATGFTLYRVLARHRATGEYVGHTVVAVDREQPDWAEQHDTTVVPAHRGHRLGLLLKTEMLGWLAEEEPQLRRIVTSNASSNAPMIAVNELLGIDRSIGQALFERSVG
jgi:RimJ/RimL family protein N-acetyltransferase